MDTEETEVRLMYDNNQIHVYHPCQLADDSQAGLQHSHQVLLHGDLTYPLQILPPPPPLHLNPHHHQLQVQSVGQYDAQDQGLGGPHNQAPLDGAVGVQNNAEKPDFKWPPGIFDG